MKKFTALLSLLAASALLSCGSGDIKKAPAEISREEMIGDFFTRDNKTGEVFRVFMSSDHYEVKQMLHHSIISRAEDKGGDAYIMDELKKHDKINEITESLVNIQLTPDSGNISKIRPTKAAFLLEIDKLIQEDLQRWSFKFPGKAATITSFSVRYRIALRKKQSDEEIMKEVREKMKESN